MAELVSHNLYKSVSQAFAALLPVHAVGVMGDQRPVAPLLDLFDVADDNAQGVWANNIPQGCRHQRFHDCHESPLRHRES